MSVYTGCGLIKHTWIGRGSFSAAVRFWDKSLIHSEWRSYFGFTPRIVGRGTKSDPVSGEYVTRSARRTARRAGRRSKEQMISGHVIEEIEESAPFLRVLRVTGSSLSPSFRDVGRERPQRGDVKTTCRYKLRNTVPSLRESSRPGTAFWSLSPSNWLTETGSGTRSFSDADSFRFCAVYLV